MGWGAAVSATAWDSATQPAWGQLVRGNARLLAPGKNARGVLVLSSHTGAGCSLNRTRVGPPGTAGKPMPMNQPVQLWRRVGSAAVDRFKRIFDLESTGRIVAYSALVGVVAGLGAAAFYVALEHTQYFCLQEVEGYLPPKAGSERKNPEDNNYRLPQRWWWVVLMPTLGGLACGLIVFTLAPEAEGHGTDAMVRAFHRLRGVIRARVPLVKAVASVLTIGTGGSAGREGPIAQIGAGFGSLLATRLKLSDFERRNLMLAGAAGGIGAIFQAPLGGALFVCEVLYSTNAIEFSALVPAVIASVVAYTVFSSMFGHGFAFTPAQKLHFHGFTELPFYLGFALLCTLVGYVYVVVFYGMRDRVFRPLRVPQVLKPALGGLLMGVLALWVPQIMAGGYGWVQMALENRMEVQLMLLLAVAKILATSLTISSGGSGGVFAPSLFIGAMLGGAYGRLCHQWFPDYVPQPEAFVLVGMAGFFAGVAKVPLTSLIMVAEMTGSYELIVPLMLVSMVSVTLLSSRITLYEEQVPTLIDSPAHLGDFVVDILAHVPVAQVYRRDRPVELIEESTPLAEVIHRVAQSRNSYFPVVDKQGRLVGIFSLSDLRAVREEDAVYDGSVAMDLATFPVLTVTPEDDLHTALRRMTQKNIDEIPVVDPQDPQRVIGMLRRKEVIAAYDQHLASLRSGQVRELPPPRYGHDAVSVSAESKTSE